MLPPQATACLTGRTSLDPGWLATLEERPEAVLSFRSRPQPRRDLGSLLAARSPAHELLGLAVISFLLSVFVLAPKSQYVATVDAAAIHEYFKREQVDVGEAMEALVYSNREVWEENQLVIDRLVRAFRWACFTLVGAVALWSIGLALQ